MVLIAGSGLVNFCEDRNVLEFGVLIFEHADDELAVVGWVGQGSSTD